MKNALIYVLEQLLYLRVATIYDTDTLTPTTINTIKQYEYTKYKIQTLISFFRTDENNFAYLNKELGVIIDEDNKTDVDLKKIEEIASSIIMTTNSDFNVQIRRKIYQEIKELNKSFEEREIIQQHGEIPKNGGGKKFKKQPKKEILGNTRIIHKIQGDKKEYVKHNGNLITVKEYKELMKAKSKK